MSYATTGDAAAAHDSLLKAYTEAEKSINTLIDNVHTKTHQHHVATVQTISEALKTAQKIAEGIAGEFDRESKAQKDAVHLLLKEFAGKLDTASTEAELARKEVAGCHAELAQFNDVDLNNLNKQTNTFRTSLDATVKQSQQRLDATKDELKSRSDQLALHTQSLKKAEDALKAAQEANSTVKTIEEISWWVCWPVAVGIKLSGIEDKLAQDVVTQIALVISLHAKVAESNAEVDRLNSETNRLTQLGLISKQFEMTLSDFQQRIDRVRQQDLDQQPPVAKAANRLSSISAKVSVSVAWAETDSNTMTKAMYALDLLASIDLCVFDIAVVKQGRDIVSHLRAHDDQKYSVESIPVVGTELFMAANLADRYNSEWLKQLEANAAKDPEIAHANIIASSSSSVGLLDLGHSMGNNTAPSNSANGDSKIDSESLITQVDDLTGKIASYRTYIEANFVASNTAYIQLRSEVLSRIYTSWGPIPENGDHNLATAGLGVVATLDTEVFDVTKAKKFMVDFIKPLSDLSALMKTSNETRKILRIQLSLDEAEDPACKLMSSKAEVKEGELKKAIWATGDDEKDTRDNLKKKETTQETATTELTKMQAALDAAKKDPHGSMTTEKALITAFPWLIQWPMEKQISLEGVADKLAIDVVNQSKVAQAATSAVSTLRTRLVAIQKLTQRLNAASNQVQAFHPQLVAMQARHQELKGLFAVQDKAAGDIETRVTAIDEAIRDYNTALSTKPGDQLKRFDFGVALMRVIDSGTFDGTTIEYAKNAVAGLLLYDPPYSDIREYTTPKYPDDTLIGVLGDRYTKPWLTEVWGQLTKCVVM